MEEQPIRTLKEVLDEGLKVTGEQELYDLDMELAKQFDTLTIMGTTVQLMAVIMAFRTAAFASAGMAGQLQKALDEVEPEEPEEKVYDA